MESIAYNGESAWIGDLGFLLSGISFSCALFAGLSWFLSLRKSDSHSPAGWENFAKKLFFLHSFALLGVIALVFLVLVGHFFEYQYAWQHTSLDMSMKYIFASFWEGQEGSFLLWAFWHVVLGFIFLRKQSEWTAPVMGTMSLVQAFISFMILGVYVFEYKIGSSPFTLVREMPENAGLPWIKNPDYLSLPVFADGRGLNPLLQNYWMTIHPPVLFLGFASTLIPFGFAVGALVRKKLMQWQSPALPWTYFSIGILGTGILMGGAWAYEALSFGGFWAWDPVENASLVPWVLIVAAGHVMLVNIKANKNHFTAIVLTLGSFLLVLYSTFLTRSGILGDSSVHAFTDLGMSGLLLIFLFSFVALAGYLIFLNRREFIRLHNKEDAFYSREFWMFVGSLTLLLAAFHISFTTSFPVINKIFGTKLAGLEIADYNKWQTGFAILILVLMGIAQFFKYRNTEPGEVFARIRVPLFSALVLSLVSGYFLGWLEFSFRLFYLLLLFAGVFSVLANGKYLLFVIKGKINHSGASIAHIGFGLLITGALISTGKTKTISVNPDNSLSSFGNIYPANENIRLNKNDTVPMGNYFVVYKGKEKDGIHILFEVEYLEKDAQGNYSQAFTLYPRIQLNERMGNSSEPDTRHFLHKDIYTHITHPGIMPGEGVEWKGPTTATVVSGDTIYCNNATLIFEGLDRAIDTTGLGKVFLAVGARVKVLNGASADTTVWPLYIIRDSFPEVREALLPNLGMRIALWKINPDTGSSEISVFEKLSSNNDFVVMKALEFPGINILWAGCLIMVAGSFIAVRQRIKKKNVA